MLITTVSGTNSKLTRENATCVQLTPSEVLSHWGAVKPFIQRWVESSQGELNPEDVLDAALRGLMQIFLFNAAGDIRLVGITEFVQYPQKKALRIVGIAGENPIVSLKFMPHIEQWAKENGACWLETWATERTVKLDMKLGMEPVYTLMRKSL